MFGRDKMQDNPWNRFVPEKGMNITNLSKAIKDAIDSLNQTVVFRDTDYSFDNDSLRSYLCVVCKNNDNRRKIVKKSGALSRTFVSILQSANTNRLQFIVNAISDDPDLKELCEKIKKREREYGKQK